MRTVPLAPDQAAGWQRPQAHLDQLPAGLRASSKPDRALPASPARDHLQAVGSHPSRSSGPRSPRGRSRCKTGTCPRRCPHSGTGLRRTGPRLRRAGVSALGGGRGVDSWPPPTHLCRKSRTAPGGAEREPWAPCHQSKSSGAQGARFERAAGVPPGRGKGSGARLCSGTEVGSWRGVGLAGAETRSGEGDV